jgi:glycerate 2-kinase
MQNAPLRDHARRIWLAGVETVKADALMARWVRRDAERLTTGQRQRDLASIDRIVVVGAGKAGAAMAGALEDALGDGLLEAKQVSGWINVPEDCVRSLRRIHLHGARPAGVNEPTEAGVEGAERILELLAGCTERDLAICLISGGGSALLPCPVEQISLAEKQAVTRFLSGAGANINELNCVRKRLSRVKGGGLARASRAGALISLIVSDVIGDPLDVIASGPTAEDTGTFREAQTVLEKFGAAPPEVSRSLLDFIAHQAEAEAAGKLVRAPFPDNVTNYVIGNNAMAVSAAKQQAEQLGYRVLNLSSYMEGHAADVGEVLAGLARGVRDAGEPFPPPACILSGGEPVVSLAPSAQRGKGGRNQELVLAAAEKLWLDGMQRIAVLSGGTDGEDGPTDAAGALADAELLRRARAQCLHPRPYLERNDSYHFFEPLGGLLQTGPTHTNVMDLRVILVEA